MNQCFLGRAQAVPYQQKHPAAVETAPAVVVFFLKKCSCGYSAVDILCQNWGSIFPGNFDIKFTHALVFTRESVLKMRVFYVVSTVVLC